jgi:hypothetical protein
MPCSGRGRRKRTPARGTSPAAHFTRECALGKRIARKGDTAPRRDPHYPGKIWLNGHEWAKRQATKAGVGFSALSNGFASCDDPPALQAICDGLGPNQILAFFERWLRVIPLPLSGDDRAAGYWWQLSLRQVEVSRTLVFDAPRRARALFEAVVRDNLDLGRPHEVELIFSGRPVRRGRPRKQPETFKTRVVTDGVDVTVNVFYKHSRIKQYPFRTAGPGASRPS